MESIRSVLTREHHACDGLVDAFEASVSQQQWDKADTLFADFSASMERHLSKEEDVLFPALEQKMGAGMGPVQVMRAEHENMRQLFSEIRADIAQRQSEHCLGLTDTLLMLIQQHNLKEEGMLYAMADQILAAEQGEIIVQLCAHAGEN